MCSCVLLCTFAAFVYFASVHVHAYVSVRETVFAADANMFIYVSHYAYGCSPHLAKTWNVYLERDGADFVGQHFTIAAFNSVEEQQVTVRVRVRVRVMVRHSTRRGAAGEG